MISSEDFVDLFQEYSPEELPYLKCIELPKLTPQNFKLEKWQSHLRIPDMWMKRIYKNERYVETDDVVLFPEPEKITDAQKKILSDYLEKCRRQNEAETLHLAYVKGARRQAPLDCLLNYLEDDNDEVLLSKSEEGSDPRIPVTSTGSDRLKSNIPFAELPPEPNLAVCDRHRIQSEETIVSIALEKMRHLKPEEEKRYRDLLKDEEFMQLLDSHVEEYCSAQ